MPVPEQFEVPRSRFHGSWCFHVNLVDITAAGDVITEFTPGFPGRIKKLYWVQGTPVTTAAKLATLNLEVNALDLAGGTIALTSAACTPLGKVINCAAITGSNTFDKDDTISLEASSVTAFAEGDGMVVIEYEGQVL